jgi:hypothetical protein
MNTRHFVNGVEPKNLLASRTLAADRRALREEEFLSVIWHERKRIERSQRSCLLMLVEMDNSFPVGQNDKSLATILTALTAATRETDVTGWYRNERVVGVLFTEITAEDGASIVTTVMSRVSDALRDRLGSRRFNQASVTFHLFPDVREKQFSAMLGSSNLYRDMVARSEERGLVQR